MGREPETTGLAGIFREQATIYSASIKSTIHKNKNIDIYLEIDVESGSAATYSDFCPINSGILNGLVFTPFGENHGVYIDVVSVYA